MDDWHGHKSARRSSSSLGGTGPKLRDSCQACALSKVKCPKEKPVCSRCESRSITCEYFLTRRPGRRRETHRQRTKSTSSPEREGGRSGERDTIQALHPLDVGFMSRSITPPGSLSGAASSAEAAPHGMSIAASPRLDDVFAADSSDVFSVLGETYMIPGLAEFGSEVNDVDMIMSAMDSPFDFSGMDTGGGGGGHAGHDIGSLLIPADGLNFELSSSETSSSADHLCSLSQVSSFASSIQTLSSGKTSLTCLTESPSCGCLTQALDLLKTLSSTTQSPLRAGLAGAESTVAPHTTSFGPAQTVLTENKQSIEAVSRNLACSTCAGDSFLLTILAMAVLKILERYAAAARAQSGGARLRDAEPDGGAASRLAGSVLSSSRDQIKLLSRTYNIGGGSSNDKGRGRMGQAVLGELHRVQRLVNQLSPKLKARGQGSREAVGDGRGGAVGPELEVWGRRKGRSGRDFGDKQSQQPAAPFSAGTLSQMESDVRKSLSALSAEIINGLRQC